MEQITKEYEKTKTEVDVQLRQVNKAQDELNQLNTTLRQVEDYNEQMKGEIGQIIEVSKSVARTQIHEFIDFFPVKT